jgi:hypothetical protein
LDGTVFIRCSDTPNRSNSTSPLSIANLLSYATLWHCLKNSYLYLLSLLCPIICLGEPFTSFSTALGLHTSHLPVPSTNTAVVKIDAREADPTRDEPWEAVSITDAKDIPAYGGAANQSARLSSLESKSSSKS